MERNSRKNLPGRKAPKAGRRPQPNLTTENTESTENDELIIVGGPFWARSIGLAGGRLGKANRRLNRIEEDKITEIPGRLAILFNPIRSSVSFYFSPDRRRKEYIAIEMPFLPAMSVVRLPQVRRIEDWFESYVRPFSRGDEAGRKNWALKYSHSLRVRWIALGLGRNLGLARDDLRLLEIASLLHDVGRFPQFHRHRTLADTHSEDHAALGARILEEEGVLSDLPIRIRKVILRAVFLHNKARLPRREDRAVLLLTRIIRDADKLDNLEEISRYYSRPRRIRIHAFELGLQPNAEIAEQFYEDIRSGKIVSLKRLKTIGELKLLVAGWIHDINFPSSFRRIKNGKYLELLRKSYPPSRRIDAVFDSLYARLEAGCHGDRKDVHE